MKYLKIFTDFREAMEPLTDEEAGRLFRAMLLYAENGAESNLFGSERYLWIVARQHMDREADAYEAKKEVLSRSGKKGAAARWSHGEPTDGKCHLGHGLDGKDNDNDKYNDNNNDNEKDNDISFFQGSKPQPVSEKKPVVTEEMEKKENHPSLEEVEKYIEYAHLPVDGEHFYNYYQANGWIMGSQPMRDWKAALKAWARNAPVAPRPASRKPQPGSREAFQAAFDMARILEAKHL